MKKLLLVKFFLILLFFSGCQTIEKKSDAILEKEQALEKWIGQPKSQLLEVYGYPTQVKKDDRGIEILIYTKKNLELLSVKGNSQ